MWLGLAEVAAALPSPKFHEYELIVPPVSVELSVKFTVRPFAVSVKFATGVLPPPLPPTIGCVIAQALVSFDQLACSVNVPVLMLTFAAPPGWPAAIHAHSSEFSMPLSAEPLTWFVQPPAG